MNPTWPELVEAVERQHRTLVVDGEIVAFEQGVTSFSRLQRRIGIEDPDRARGTGVAVRLYLFDILHLDGRDVTSVAQRERKSLLRRAIAWHDPLRFTPHRNEEGEEWLERACRKRWEGLIAKRADAPYRHGRSRDWLKFKCGNRQEFVVVGFTEPKGSRPGFGALVLGYHDGRLRRPRFIGLRTDKKPENVVREEPP